MKIAKYALYCNGVRRNGVNVFDCSENGTFSGVFDSLMKEKVTAFQNFTGMLEVTGKIELKEWMSLLVSTGYPMRNVLACDTSTQLTDTKAKRLVSNDFEIVGRYLTGRTTSGPKYLTRDELNMLFEYLLFTRMRRNIIRRILKKKQQKIIIIMVKDIMMQKKRVKLLKI